MKDKNNKDDRQPFFDFSTLRSKTVRILLMSTGISAFGINTPIFYLAYHAEEEGMLNQKYTSLIIRHFIYFQEALHFDSSKRESFTTKKPDAESKQIKRVRNIKLLNLDVMRRYTVLPKFTQLCYFGVTTSFVLIKTADYQ